MNIEVTYMSGAGNLFSVIDLRELKFSDEELSKIAVLLCNSNQFNGIRTEGLLCLNSSEREDADFSVRFFNPDGSYGMMCGNGGRCAIRYAHRFGFTDKVEVNFSLGTTLYSGVSGDIIDIYFPPPSLITDKSVAVDEIEHNGTFVEIGTQHFVTKLNVNSPDEFKKFEIRELGKKIRNHQDFAPKGTNANFFLEWNGKLLLRTFERGVEAETGACGTGAISTVLAYFSKNKAKETMEVIPSSGIPLWVKIERKDDEIERIVLSGSAEIIGSQSINLPDNFIEI